MNETDDATTRGEKPASKMLQIEVARLAYYLDENRRDLAGLRRSEQKAAAEKALGFKVSDTALRSLIEETEKLKGLEIGWLRHDTPAGGRPAIGHDAQAREAIATVAHALAGLMKNLGVEIPPALLRAVGLTPERSLFDAEGGQG